MTTLFADRIRTAKQLNRRSGQILAEARDHPVTVVTEGAEPVVIQSRTDAARQAHAESVLRRFAALMAHLGESETKLPHELRWVDKLAAKNLAQFKHELPIRVVKALRAKNLDAFEDWLYDWEVASEVDASPMLRKRLGLRG